MISAADAAFALMNLDEVSISPSPALCGPYGACLGFWYGDLHLASPRRNGSDHAVLLVNPNSISIFLR